MDMLQDPQYKTPDGAALRIWRDTALNKFASEREGRTLYDEVIYCEVITPGSRDSTPVFELERIFCKEANHPLPKYGTKYAELKQWVDDFKKTDEADASLSGTPLAQWPEMNRSLVASLKAQGVFTVDALAALADSKLAIVGPDGREWRAKASAYIESAKNSGYATELAAKVENLSTELADERTRSQVLAARVQELETAAATGAKAPETAAVAIAPVAEAAPSII